MIDIMCARVKKEPYSGVLNHVTSMGKLKAVKEMLKETIGGVASKLSARAQPSDRHPPSSRLLEEDQEVNRLLRPQTSLQ